MKQRKETPKFSSEQEERLFWLGHDSADFIDWNKAVKNPGFAKLTRRATHKGKAN